MGVTSLRASGRCLPLMPVLSCDRDSRVFNSVPFPLTHPTTLQDWSARKSPGERRPHDSLRAPPLTRKGPRLLQAFLALWAAQRSCGHTCRSVSRPVPMLVRARGHCRARCLRVLQDLVSAAASMVRNQTSTPLDSFPILLFATAGMRVLPDRDRERWAAGPVSLSSCCGCA